MSRAYNTPGRVQTRHDGAVWCTYTCTHASGRITGNRATAICVSSGSGRYCGHADGAEEQIGRNKHGATSSASNPLSVEDPSGSQTPCVLELPPSGSVKKDGRGEDED